MALGTAWSGSPSMAADGQNTMMDESRPAIAVASAEETESEAPLASAAPSALATAAAPEATAAKQHGLYLAEHTGISALLAAGSYFYFARKSAVNARNWDAQVSGGVDPEGDMNVGALITLPLPSLSR